MGTINRAALLEPCPTEQGELVGRDPRELSPADLAAAGIEAAPVLKIVRQKCIDCCGGSEKEVRLCVAVSCPLWPLRMGSNPFRAPASEGRRAQLREGLAKARAGRAQRSELLEEDPA
jgi:hypothetical protein